MANINYKVVGKEVVEDAVKISISLLRRDLDVTPQSGAISMTELSTNELPIILNAIRHDEALMNTETQVGFDYVFDFIFD